jgi:hypothetical protein
MAAHATIMFLLTVCKPVRAGSALEAELLKAAATPFNMTSGPVLRFKASPLTCSCTICPGVYALVEDRTGSLTCLLTSHHVVADLELG